MNSNEIIEKLKLTLDKSPEEIPVNILVKGFTANKVHFISQLMLAENPGYTDEDIYEYIFWSGANKILEDLANNVQNDNPES
jgi:hypothetical protein